MELRCPRCQSRLSLEDVSPDAPVRCGVCNALFVVPDASKAVHPGEGPVIDVHAEPVSGSDTPAGRPVPGNGHSGASEFEKSRGAYGPSGRYIGIEKRIPVRDSPDFGCCGCGCLLLLLLFLLFVAGCASLTIS